MKDVEFAVNDVQGKERIFASFDKAAGFAAGVSVALGGKYTNVDVLVYSKAGARAYLGSDGVDMYEEDPEASVFERIVIKAQSVGRIP